LRIAGIDRNTPNPDGGEIGKDNNGEPNGILLENAFKLVMDKVPKGTREEKIKTVLQAQDELLKLGITTVGDFDPWPETISDLLTLEKNNKLKIRIFKMVYPENLEKNIKLKKRTGRGSEFARTGALKLFADGALGSQTALMFIPFKGSRGNTGISTLNIKEMAEYISYAGRNGVSTFIHAIGDRANYNALRAINNKQAILKKFNLLPRIEHAQILRKKEIPEFSRLGIIASVQPIHASSDRDVADKYLGSRARYTYPFKTMLDSGVELAFGSDAPIESPNPMLGIFAAVARKRANERRGSWYPQEKITRAQALRAYTQGSSKGCYFDDITGKLEIGKKADFVVLSSDLFKVRISQIPSIKTQATIINGKIVYNRSFF
jgi:predicted amidohydrolase YtcJ